MLLRSGCYSDKQVSRFLHNQLWVVGLPKWVKIVFERALYCSSVFQNCLQFLHYYTYDESYQKSGEKLVFLEIRLLHKVFHPIVCRASSGSAQSGAQTFNAHFLVNLFCKIVKTTTLEKGKWWHQSKGVKKKYRAQSFTPRDARICEEKRKKNSWKPVGPCVYVGTCCLLQFLFRFSQLNTWKLRSNA